MATPFTSVWPTAAAGTMAYDDVRDRQAFYIRHDLDGGAVEWYWTQDGTSGTSTILDRNNEVIWAFPISRDPNVSNAYGYTGVYGPIHNPSDQIARSLHFIRTEYDSSSGWWKSTVYAAGTDSSGNLISDRSGGSRPFLGYLVGL